MQVRLDEEIWEMSDELQLERVLADLSDRAQAKGRLVTQLIIGEREMTDRDLIPVTLSQAAGTFGDIAAKSERLEHILHNSRSTARNFGEQLHREARSMVTDFRAGQGNLRLLDQWFGQMADYLEWSEIDQAIGSSDEENVNLSQWVAELIDARQTCDHVRVADLLEYEIIPRLPVLSTP